MSSAVAVGLARVPCQCVARRLGDVCDVLVGGTPDRRRPEYWATKGVAGHTWVTISDLNRRTITSSAERITDLGVATSKVRLVPAGAILASFKLTIGRVAVAGEPLYTNEAIAALMPSDEVDRDYLVQVLPSVFAGVAKNATSMGVTLTKAKILDQRLPLPSLEEQKRIAASLSSVDRTIEATDVVVESLGRVHRELATTLLRRVSRAATMRVGEVAEFVPGHTFTSSDWSTTGLPILRTANLNGSKAFHYFAGRPKAAWLVPPGTLLFSWAGTPGKSLGPRVWEGPTGLLNQHVYRVEAKGTLVTRDYLTLTLHEVTRALEARSPSFNGRLTHIRLDDLLNAVVPVPSLIEQKRMCERLRKVEEASRTNRDRLARLRELKHCLLRDLLG